MEDLGALDPRRLGPYRPCAVLGEGGMGRVLLATGRHGRLVAIKRVHEHLAGDEEFRRRFRREVAASRRVTSTHTAPVVDADTDADVPWLASEFVHGPALRRVLEEIGPLPEDAVLRLAAGLAAALRDIHGAGLVHRDLSPSNVLLAEDGPKVIDFGIVRAVEGAGTTRRHTMTTTVTRSGSVIGAPGFMSPEQAEGRALTPASDLFPLGTVLLMAFTGNNPFEGPGIPQTMYNVVHSTPDLDGLPDRLRRVVEPCLAKAPGDRPTPARVLELIGPLPEAEAFWSPGVRRLAEEQRAEVRRRVPASEAPTTTASAVPTPTVVVPPTPPTPPPAAPPTTPPTAPAVLVPPPPPPPPGRPARAWSVAGTALGVTILLVALALNWSSDDDDTAGGSGGTGGPSASFSPETDPATEEEDEPLDDYEADPGTDTADPGYEPEPEPTTPAPNVFRDAVEGDCFSNHGTMDDLDLEPASCGDGTFEAVAVIRGSTDYDDCEGTEDTDWRVNNSAHEVTLCLSYRHSNGDAFHAERGDCVYGAEEDGSVWTQQSCDTGNFTVVARLGDDSSSWDDCDDWDWEHGRHFSVDQWPELNVRLCLAINYPDDAGRAEVDNCLLMSGPESDRHFAFSDCDSANVYVTGRTGTYDDPGFCGDHGWTTWRNNDFPDLGYTMCWRWL